jgi:hypothetical protein
VVSFSHSKPQHVERSRAAHGRLFFSRHILSTAGGQLPVQRMPRYALQSAISSATSTKSTGLVEC